MHVDYQRRGNESPLALVLVGAGAMAADYVKALFNLGWPANEIRVVGRSRERTERFAKQFDLSCAWGGTRALNEIPKCDIAIVAVSHLELPEVANALIDRGCRYVLLEKPGALYRPDLESLATYAARAGVHIFVGFNRRFYKSVDVVRQMIEADGGVLSCNFDFTEIERLVINRDDPNQYPAEVLGRWGIVNSLHVIDLFLHLAGMPLEWSHYHDGSVWWHPTAATFSGAGTTERGVLFSYLSTWNGAGRWSVEFTTSNRKLILRPLESLASQLTGKFELNAEAIAQEPDGLKPGLRDQVAAFLEVARGGVPDPRLCTISEAVRHFKVAETILGYAE